MDESCMSRKFPTGSNDETKKKPATTNKNVVIMATYTANGAEDGEPYFGCYTAAASANLFKLKACGHSCT